MQTIKGNYVSVKENFVAPFYWWGSIYFLPLRIG